MGDGKKSDLKQMEEVVKVCATPNPDTRPVFIWLRVLITSCLAKLLMPMFTIPNFNSSIMHQIKPSLPRTHPHAGL